MISFEQGLYAGEFRHNLDAKKRLTVPSKWRFEGDEKALYLAFRNPCGCVTIYPPALVQELKNKLSSIKLGDQKAQRAVMKLFSGADQFTIDKNGRINLSERLYQQAEISREVVLVGGVDKFHLWNPERYDAYISADEDDGDLSDVLSELGL
ncbi:hypothetical protein H5P28_13920 [Ruficoccus amylovorans]|uniref:Transcriptional regulator MraZ n=1 Tax=Ruficoccus amylovorans TaxID=1804625 RepID=A0A842HGQ5_9BACT|nr:hypothetical protein [Ruficoccus amylovorans]MBC2595360.1 hypothetical protein [Ruficoccus amylovorans]